jgi:hypothetical protein
MWKFDPLLVDIVFVQSTTSGLGSGLINFGELLNDDLQLDAGERTLANSVIDGGDRLDGDI